LIHNMSGKDNEAYYGMLDKIFSRASEIYDQKILSNFVNVNIRKVEMSVLLAHSFRGCLALEMGQGTGEESSQYIMTTGNQLDAVDISTGMVEYSRRKMERLGIGDHYNPVHIPAAEIGRLNKTYDVVYSFNGLVNTEPDLEGLRNGLSEVTKPGSVIIVSFRNRSCLGENILRTITGRTDIGMNRRAKLVDVQVAGDSIPSTYFSLDDIYRILPENFRVVGIYGLAVLLPPYLAEVAKSRILKTVIVALERAVCFLPFTRTHGDEMLIVARRYA
jgi:ubiquinone/menaquinone biosynthesis C-methylase UbiE